MIDYLFELESKRYPYYDIIEIDIVSVKGGIIEYRVHVCSKISPEWKKWEPTRKIKIPEIISEYRDYIIDKILT